MLSWLFFRRYLMSKRAGSLVKRIAWLSMLSIGVAVAAFILVLSVMSGLHENINQRILALEPHLIIEFDRKLTEEAMAQHPIQETLLGLKGVDYQPFDRQDVILRSTEGVFHGAVARGVSESSLENMQERLMTLENSKSAAVPTFLDVPEEDQVILGSSLAAQMNVYEGDYVTVLSPESLLMAPGENPPFSKVMVKQIVSTNVSELDSEMVLYIRGKALLNFSKTGSRSRGWDLWLKDPYDAGSVKEQLARFTDLKIQTWRERNSAVFLALRLEKLMLGSFLGLSALITTFSIWSVLTLLITQKRREMGLLMAIGLSGRRLMDLFQKVGMYLASIGLGGGLFLGISTALYIENNPLQVLPDIYYDSEVPAKVDFVFIAIVFVTAIIVIYGAVRLAMSRLSTLRSSEALRGN